MPYTEKSGTFAITLYDGETPLALVSLRQATISIPREALEAANPDEYGWRYPIPGEASWTGSASFVHITGTGGTGQDEVIAFLIAAHLAGDVLTTTFTSPLGETYSGDFFFTAFETGGSYADVYEASVELTGQGRILFGLPASPEALGASSPGGDSIVLTWE